MTIGSIEHSYNGQRGLLRDGTGLGITSQVHLLPEYNPSYVSVLLWHSSAFAVARVCGIM